MEQLATDKFFGTLSQYDFLIFLLAVGLLHKRYRWSKSPMFSRSVSDTRVGTRFCLSISRGQTLIYCCVATVPDERFAKRGIRAISIIILLSTSTFFSNMPTHVAHHARTCGRRSWWRDVITEAAIYNSLPFSIGNFR